MQLQNYSTQMRKRVRAAIIFMLVMSISCTILATIVWKQDRNSEIPSHLLLGVLFTLTGVFDLFQVFVLGQLLIVLKRTQVKFWVAVSVVIVSGLICLSFILSNTFADIDWMLLDNLKYRTARIASEWFQETLMYVATIFLVWHISNMNKSTLKLITRIQTIDSGRLSQMMKHETESSEQNQEEYESSNSGFPPEVVIPRKITLFRVVMERKLGIDWEHS